MIVRLLSILKAVVIITPLQKISRNKIYFSLCDIVATALLTSRIVEIEKRIIYK